MPIQAGGPGSATAAPSRCAGTSGGDINAFDVHHGQFVGLDIDRSGDTFHCERCSQVQLRRGPLSQSCECARANRATMRCERSDGVLTVGPAAALAL